MASHFPAISQYAILLLAIFIAIATHQIQGRPFKPTTKQDLKPQVPLHFSPSVSFSESDAGSKDDFRPTMPGNSPGVGHHVVERSGAGGAAQLANNMEGLKDDSRATMPGYSAGIGHALHSIASKPNA